MKYQDLSIIVPAKDRKEVNGNILMLINSGDLQGITPEEIFNCYTGIGGLHDLEFSSFNNRHSYTEAKKEVENGQFFTPNLIAQKISSLIDLKQNEFIADLTFGHGVFINCFPETNFYGCELDNKAYQVAKFLFPVANIEQKDIRYYSPAVRFDFIIGNPPFNLSWKINNDTVKSQEYFFSKAAELMRPAGLIIAIVPQSYCADEFSNAGEIEELEQNYNFLFNVLLENDTFKSIGVSNFPTKIICLQKKSDHLEEKKYTPAAIEWEQAQAIFSEQLAIYRKIKIKVNSEMGDVEYDNNSKIKKYLYEIKTHAAIKDKYPKAIEIVEQFRNQKCPDNMDFDTWHKKHRISINDVLGRLRRIIKRQNETQIDKISLVKTTYGFKYKAYSDKSRYQLNHGNNYPVKKWYLNELVTEAAPIPRFFTSGFKNIISRKIKAYQLEQKRHRDIIPVNQIINYLNGFKWICPKAKQPVAFNDIQKTDLGRVLTKSYGNILNWQQGSGKTSAAYAWSKYRPMKKTFILSSALSINITWSKFLTVNNESFTIIKSLADLEKCQYAEYILISHHFMVKYEKQIKKLVKCLSYKISFILDESDEITNHLAKRTRAIKNTFQRYSKRKLLATGTTTRNNISELYTQLELLYNNSVNFICSCEKVYIENVKEKVIEEEENEYYNQPFPPYYGNRLFRQCFNPSKTTVFGIQQYNQSIYNENQLRFIIEKTIITRKFKEIAGDKYSINNVAVYQSPYERHVYSKILREFHEIVSNYFQSTGSSRKDSQLRIIRQLQLLIQATSTPHLFHEYEGGTTPPNKASKIAESIRKYNEKVAIGCITLEAMEWYAEYIKASFPDRQLFLINGSVQFKKREKLLEQFEATENGILVCTQQSLESSVNIPTCNKVFIESLQWNIPTIEQFYFRFIRYNSAEHTDVIFFNYHDTIEANLLALLMDKEKLNDYIKTLDYRNDEDMFGEYDINMNILDSLITKEKDEEGHVYVKWGQSTVYS